MTQEEIEQEIQARIEFKYEEFKTSLKNRLQFKYGQMWDMTHKSQYIWEAFNEISGMIGKEVSLPTPSNEMVKERKWKAKEKAIDKIMDILQLRGSVIIKETYEKIGENGNAMRTRWVAVETPIFTQDKEFLIKLMPIGN